jgi:pimeloyl-ACP methyl ester carboxylesterase
MVALVLLPGLDGTGLLFKDFVASLGSDIEVIVATYPPDIALDYSELESVARAFMPHDRPYFVLAESFSGPLAISIAASSPPGLLGLILCCSFVRNPLPLLGILRPALDVVPVAALPMAVLSFLVLGRFATPLLREELAKSLALVAPAVLRARVRAVLSANVSLSLSRINVPLLYLRASEDRLVPGASSEIIVSLAPHTKVVDFPAPHFLLQVLPSAAASAVAEFVAACPASSGVPLRR